MSDLKNYKYLSKKRL